MKPFVFEARGVTYKMTVLDDGLTHDPTLLVFRNDEEEPVVTAHLRPGSDCGSFPPYGDHITVRPIEED